MKSFPFLPSSLLILSLTLSGCNKLSSEKKQNILPEETSQQDLEKADATPVTSDTIQKTEDSIEDSIIQVGTPKPPEGMVYIPGGTFLRGSEGPQDNGETYPEEAPINKVRLDSFFIDKTEVTNTEFKKFVDATNYVTFAERGPSKEDFPNAPAEALLPGASVFMPPAEKIDPRKHSVHIWWPYIKDASWKHPLGKSSSIKNQMDHPVVCINYDDAKAYAEWAGKRLPTEAEWEYAARGGLEQKKYIWGDKRLPGKWMANCFQGSFPAINTLEDGFLLTAPVKSFEPNGYGLYDMAGNVWEICSDYYRPDYYSTYIKNPIDNPQGPETGITEQEIAQWRQTGKYEEPTTQPHRLLIPRVSRGGSFLCHVEYCLRYRPAARHESEPLTPTNHTGFRCVSSIKK